jgi:autotransporter adhesin
VVVSEIALNHGKNTKGSAGAVHLKKALIAALLVSGTFGGTLYGGMDSYAVDLGNQAAATYDANGNLAIGKNVKTEGKNNSGSYNTAIGTDTDTIRDDGTGNGQAMDGSSNTKLVDGEGQAHELERSTEASSGTQEGSTALGYNSHAEGDASTAIGNKARVLNKPTTYYADADGNKTTSQDDAAWYKDSNGKPTKVPQVFRDADNKTTTTPQYIHTYQEKDAATGQMVTKTEITTDATKADKNTDGSLKYNYQKADNKNKLYSVTLYQPSSNSIAAGSEVEADGENAVAVGYQSTAQSSAVAIGDNAQAEKDTVAIGKQANASAEGGVALGMGSTANRAGGISGWDPKTGTTSTAEDSVWKSGSGAISVGSAGSSRQITNVAAGSEDSDAVNLAQLKKAMIHYYSVKTTEATDQAGNNNYLNDGATGDNALAAGVRALAFGDNSTAVGTDSQAQGQNSAAYGYGAIAFKEDSTAMGSNAQAQARSSTAYGSSAIAKGSGSTVIGYGATSQGEESVAIGGHALGNYSVQVGTGSTSQGISSVAVGGHATGDNSVVVGNNSTAQGEHSVSVGGHAIGTQSTAIGYGANSPGRSSIAVGGNTHNDNETAIGSGATTSGGQSVTVGGTATGSQSVSVGNNANATSQQATTVGFNTSATGSQSTALGYNSHASNSQSVAIGGSTANSNQAVAIGSGAAAGSYYNGYSGMTAIGQNSHANGNGSTALGNSTDAGGLYTSAIGYGSNAYGSYTMAMGGASVNGTNSIAVGNSATAQDTSSIAIGNASNVSGTGSIGIGSGAKASNSGTAVGYGVQAGGSESTAIGVGSQASGANATAIGGGGAWAAGSVAIGSGAGTNTNAVSIGKDSNAWGVNGVSLGTGSSATGLNSTAIGGGKAYSDEAIAIGSNAQTNKAITIGKDSSAWGDSAIAIGEGADAWRTNSIVIGRNSKSGADKNIQGFDPLTGKASTESSATWNSTDEAVSFGRAEERDEKGNVTKAAITRQLNNVAAGTLDTDAVNVAQLKLATTKINMHYYSVHSTETGDGSNFANDGASGVNAMAAGPNASATAENAVAIGYGATATGKGSTAIGQYGKAIGVGSTAFGGLQTTDRKGNLITYTNTAKGAASVAFGEGAAAKGAASLAFGRNTVAGVRDNEGQQSVAFGENTQALGGRSLAFGENTKAEFNDSVAFGNASQALSTGAMAHGNRTSAVGQYTTTWGNNTVAAGENSTAFGKDAMAGAIDENGAVIVNYNNQSTKIDKNGYKAYIDANGNTQSGTYTVNGGETHNYVILAGTDNKKYICDYHGDIREVTSIDENGVITAGNVVTNAPVTKIVGGTNGFNVDGHQNATAFGNATRATAAESTAWGQGSIASGEASTAFGIKSKAEGKNSLAGLGGQAINENSIALGKDTKANNKDNAVSVAIGENAEASGARSLAIGFGVSEKVGTKDDTNLTQTTASGESAVSIGTDTQAAGQHSLAMGSHTSAAKDSSIAIGYDTHAVNDSTVAIGSGTQARGRYSVAMGLSSVAGTETNDANNPLDGGGSVAIGYAASAEATRSVAIGTGSSAYENAFTTALGDSSIASQRGSVALGAGSNATRAAGNLEGGTEYKKAYLMPDTATADDITWTSTEGAVSVGGTTKYIDYDESGKKVTKTKNITRQITNVAAGSEDTDAVNVAQLKRVKEAMDSVAGAHTAVTVNDKSKPTAAKVGGGQYGDYAGGEADNLHIAAMKGTDGKMTYNIKLNDQLNIGKKGADGTDGKVTVDTKGGTTVIIGHDGENGKDGKDGLFVRGDDGKDGKSGVSIIGPNGQTGDAGIDGKVGIAGKDGKDAVSISGKDGVGHIGLTGPKGADGKDGTSIDLSTDYRTKTLNLDKNTTVNGEEKASRIVYKDAKGDHEVATMDDGLKFIGDDDTATPIAKKLNETLQIRGDGTYDATTKKVADDGNIKTSVADGAVKVSLSDKINLHQNGSLTLGGDANGTEKDGTDPITIRHFDDKTLDVITGVDKEGKPITSKEGKAGDYITGLDNKTWNNESYVSGRAATEDQLHQAVSDLIGPGANGGFGLSANGGKVTQALGKTIAVNGDGTYKADGTETKAGNISTSVKDGAIQVSLNKDLNIDSTTMEKTNDDGSKVTNKTTAEGSTIVKTDASGKTMASTTANAGSLTITNGNTSTVINENGVSTNKVTVGKDTTIDDGSAKIGKVTIHGNGENDGNDQHKSTITGLSNTTFDTNHTEQYENSGRAATEAQLKQVYDKASQHTTVTVNGKPSASGNLKLDTTTNDDGSTNYAISLNNDVTLGDNDKDGKLTVKSQDGTKSITTDGKEGTLTFQDGNHTASMKAAESVKAVDGTTDIKRVAVDGHTVATMDDGMKFAGDSGEALQQKLNSTTNIKGGAAGELSDGNIGVVSDGKDTLTVKLAKDIKGLNSVEATTINATTVNSSTFNAGNTTMDNSGVTIKTGDSGRTITIKDGGVSMGGNQIHNVAPGTAPDDAVNVSQLNATNGVVNKLGSRINKVGAGAAALAALHPLDFDPDDKWDVAAGYGHYKNADAAAIGAFYQPNEDTMLSIGGSFGGGENMVNAGVSVKLGQGNHVSTSRVAMAKEIRDLRENVAKLNDVVNRQSALIDKLTGVNAGTIQDRGNDLFPDVPANHWAYEYVTALHKAGILEGYPDGTFSGDRMMTRYEFAAIVYRAIMAGAASNPALNRDGTLDKLAKEFSSEMKYIRIDTISKDRNGNPDIQRVRVIPQKQEKK